jgi:hypothetical protein
MSTPRNASYICLRWLCRSLLLGRESNNKGRSIGHDAALRLNVEGRMANVQRACLGEVRNRRESEA